MYGNENIDMQCVKSVFFQMKMKLLKECGNIVDNKLVTDKITVSFCGKDADPGTATQTHLPVLIYSCPSNFSTVQYFEALETEEIGRLVIYAEVLTSSHHILTKKLQHGLAVIPRIQVQGQGKDVNVYFRFHMYFFKIYTYS